MSSQNRTTREAQTRAVTPVRRKSWQPVTDTGLFPELQNDPNWAYRWVNVSVQKETDIVDAAYLKKVREGWSPVNPGDHTCFSTGENQRLVKNGGIQRSGQVLMRMPRDMAEERNAYYMKEDRTRRNVRLQELATKGARDEGVPDGMFDKVQPELSRTAYVGEQTANL